MPCQDGGVPLRAYDVFSAHAHQKRALQERLDNVTAMLCKLCASVEEYNRNREVGLPLDAELFFWYAHHKNLDEERERREATEKAEAQRLRKEEYEKLKQEFG